MPIRSATAADYNPVADLQRRTMPNYTYTQYANNIGRPNITSLVYEDEGRVVGFITMLHFAFDTKGNSLWQRMGPYVGFIAVLPEYQNQGIGTQLHQQARARIQALGFTDPVWLECEADELQMRKHASAGFVRVDPAEVERRFGVSPRAAVMRWD